MAKGDAVYANCNVDWHRDPRCNELGSPTAKWINHIYWVIAVKERRSTLPAHWNYRAIAKEAGCRTKEVQKTAERMAEIGLAKIESDGRITIIGVRTCHKALHIWKDEDFCLNKDRSSPKRGKKSPPEQEQEQEKEQEQERAREADLPDSPEPPKPDAPEAPEPDAPEDAFDTPSDATMPEHDPVKDSSDVFEAYAAAYKSIRKITDNGRVYATGLIQKLMDRGEYSKTDLLMAGRRYLAECKAADSYPCKATGFYGQEDRFKAYLSDDWKGPDGLVDLDEQAKSLDAKYRAMKYRTDDIEALILTSGVDGLHEAWQRTCLEKEKEAV